MYYNKKQNQMNNLYNKLITKLPQNLIYSFLFYKQKYRN